MPTVRTVFEPWKPIEVSDYEAQTMGAQGLLVPAPVEPPVEAAPDSPPAPSGVAAASPKG